MLELPKGTIDLDGKWLDKTGYEWAKEKGHTHILWLLAEAGHGDKQEVVETIKSKGAEEFRK